MKKIWFIASREFTATVGTRSFIIGIFFMPALLAFFVAVGPKLAQNGPQVRGELVLMDPTGLVGEELRRSVTPEALSARRLAATQAMAKQAAAAVENMKQPALQPEAAATALVGAVPAFTVIERAPADLQSSLSWLRESPPPAAKRLGVLVIHPDAVLPAAGRADYGTYDFFQPTTIDEATQNAINESVRVAIVAARLKSEKLDQQHIDSVVTVAAPVVRVVTAQGKVEPANLLLNRLIPGALLIFLMVGAYTGAGALLSTTVEEKFNRVMEVLLSSVSPYQLMVGKILGQLAVSAVAMGLYLGLAVLALSSFATLGLVDPLLIVYLLIFFLTTYLIVGALMGAVGAAVNDLRDAQALLMPLNIVMAIPWLLAIPILRNPDSTVAMVLSFVPPVNSFAMLLRLSTGSPPPVWQVVVSIAISLLAAAAALWFASKLFRIALLLHGKPPDFATLIRWARAA